MRKVKWLVLALLIPASMGMAQAAESGRKTTPDGRFNTRCDAWGNDPAKELCEVSFYRLVARPEAYHGRLIAVHGFLIRLFGTQVLFANEASYEAGVNVEGIELLGFSAYPDDVRSKLATGVFPVVVVGTFDAKYSGMTSPRLGAIRDISHVLFAPRMSASD